MRTGALWELSVAASSLAEEAVTELLAEWSGQTPSAYTDARTRRTRVSVFLPGRARPGARTLALLRAGLQRLRRDGLPLPRAPLRMRRLRGQDWTESWKHHFKPVHIGGRLLLRPSWSREKARTGERVITLDPGLAFGTGQHPTTAFCLEQIVRHSQGSRRDSFLDLGTGSGILAIAAAKLGYGPILGLDHDPLSVRVAQANARRNRVHRALRLVCQDLRRLPRRPRRQWDLVCANLTADVLIGERDRIAAAVALGGRLVVAGILRGQFPGVQAAYREVGLRLVEGVADGEWRSGALEPEG